MSRNRGSGWWRVSVCYKDVDGTFQERILLPRRFVPLGGNNTAFLTLMFSFPCYSDNENEVHFYLVTADVGNGV